MNLIVRLRFGFPWFLGVLALAEIGCMSHGPKTPLEPSAATSPPIAQRIEGPLDHRPYEFQWNSRQELIDPLLDFDFLLGWTIQPEDCLTASFDRSQDQQLWGAFVGKLAFDGNGTNSTIRLLPPKPIEIRNRFDSVSVWVYGPYWAEGAVRGQNPSLSIWLADAKGEPFHLALGEITWEGWNLLHKRLARDELSAFDQPCQLLGIVWEHGGVETSTTYYMDSLSFYSETFKPISSSSCLWAGESITTNIEAWTGNAVAPFSERVAEENEITELAHGKFALRHRSSAGVLSYIVDCAALNEGIRVVWSDLECGHFLQGISLVDDVSIGGEFQVARKEGDTVYIKYASGVVCTFWIHGNSLFASIQRHGDGIGGLRLGRYAGDLSWNEIEVPGLIQGGISICDIGWLGPPGTNHAPLFASVLLDWFSSEASRWIRNGAGELIAVYGEMTDGKRQHLSERIVLTVAPKIERVLPTVRNPIGGHRNELCDRIWVDLDGPHDNDNEARPSDALAELGITSVVQGGHLPSFWKNGQESHLLRAQAASGWGGGNAFIRYLQHLEELGWTMGLWVNYLQIHPLNQFWDVDILQRTSSMEWKFQRPGDYLVKPSAAVRLQGDQAPKVTATFKPGMSYVGAMAGQPPWIHTDYDARVSGAGTFAESYRCIGSMLRQESQIIQGPVVGDSGAEAFYAGMYDGYLVRGRREKVRPIPFLPVFLLEQLQPLALQIGVGDEICNPSSFQRPSLDLDVFVDRYIASEIAYGACGRLASAGLGRIRQCRSYYMMSYLQPYFTRQSLRRVAYWNGLSYDNTSDAIVTGSINHSMLYLQYGEELEIWVNGSRTNTWNVRVGPDEWELPPFGWIASAPDFLELSVSVEGRRLDYVSAFQDRYLDGRGQWVSFRGLACSGPLSVRTISQEDGFRLVFTDLSDAGKFGFVPSRMVNDQAIDVKMMNKNGTLLGTTKAHFTDGLFLVQGEQGTRTYIVELPADS